MVFILTPAFSIQVDVDEIRKTRKIEFENYTGKITRSDPAAEVNAIGRGLAMDLKKAGDNKKVFYHTKYSIIHAVSKDEPEKLSADVFSIDRDSMVTHINIVRRIVSSYLQAGYGYSKKNSDTISLYLTYYNAIHRGDINYLSSRYKKIVLSHLTEKNAGISTKYYDWPGKTRLLIPLTENAKLGGLDSIDPDIISDKNTKEEIKKDDRNIDSRKDMAEIREKKLEKDKAALEEKKKDDKRQEKIVAEKKKEVEKKKEDLKKKEDEIKKDKDEAKKTASITEKKKKEDEIAKKEDALKKEKDEVRKKEEEVKKDEKKVEAKKEETKKQEEKIVKKEQELKEEKKDIEKDELKKDIKSDPKKAEEKLAKKSDELEKKEKELDKREDTIRDSREKNIFANKFFYLKLRDYIESGHYNNELYMINPATKKIEFKSPVEHICGSRYDIFSEGIVIITHNGDHKAGHRLTLVDREKLTAKISGKDNIFWRSFVEIKEGFIYAIMYDNGTFYLGRFDGELKLAAKSKEKINENTFISFYEDFIYINSEDKRILVLKKSDLSLVDTIRP